MEQMIKVYYPGRPELEVIEVTFEEAKKIVDAVYEDPIGGLVFDADTKEVLWTLGADVKEILIMDQVIGGG